MTKTRIKLCAGATVLATAGAALVTVGPAGAATSTKSTNSYSIAAQAQAIGISGTLGGGIFGKLFSGHLGIGTIEANLNTKGVKSINGQALPKGVNVAGRADLLTTQVAGFNPVYYGGQVSAPAGNHTLTRNLVSFGLGGLGSVAGFNGSGTVAWNPAKTMKLHAPAAVIGKGFAQVGSVNLLDIGKLAGPLASLLPSQLQGPLLQVITTKVSASEGTTVNKDGTHGLYGQAKFGLLSLNILGGSAKGGISLDLFSNEDGGDGKNAAGVRLWANGKPGGAGCDFTQANWVRVAIGNNSIGLPISIGQRIDLPFNLGYLDFNLAGPTVCRGSADGTQAQFSGGGAGIKFHLQLPGHGALADDNGVSLGDLLISLPDVNNARIYVKKGGIKPVS